MGDRRSFGWAGGRQSPFLGAYSSPPSNLSSHFEYIDPDDEDIYSGTGTSSHRPYTTRTTYRVGEVHDDPEEPDRINVVYLGERFSIELPAYAISEERVKVRDLRRLVADRIHTSSDRVRLVYKGHEVKRNAYPLRQYGMKQNSEVSAIVTEHPRNYEQDQDSSSESGSDSGEARKRRQQQQQHQRPRSVSSVRHRGDEPTPLTQPNGNGFLSPTGHLPSSTADRRSWAYLRPSETQHRDTVRPSSRGPADYRDGNTRREREPSRSRRTASPTRASATNLASSPSSSSRQPSPAAADPNSPLGKVQALQSTLRTEWLPKCRRYIANPPADEAVRYKEYLKLSESVMQLVDKADATELGGNEAARALRKGLINEANAVVKDLDAVPKKER